MDQVPPVSGRPRWILIPAFVGVVLYVAGMTAAGYGGAAGLHHLLNRHPSSSTVAHSEREPVQIESAPPLFLSWPEEKPDLALVLTGQMNGYMRPCGCSDGQLGGLPRRAGFLKYLMQEKQWPTLPVELGDIVDKTGEMEELRYQYSLESLVEMGYPVVGVGPGDLGLGVITLVGFVLNLDKSELLLANLEHEVLKEALASEGQWFETLAVQQVNGLNVAVSLLMAPGPQMEPGASLQAPQEVVDSIVQKMNEAKVDLKVLLAQMSFEEAAQFAEQHPHFDVILSRSEYEDSAAQEAKMIGNTMVTWVGKKGKSVGVIGYWKDQNPRFRFEVVPLDPRFEDVERMNEIYAQFVSDIKNRNFLEKVPKYPPAHGDHYVGAENCASCHQAIYDHWKTTKHAHAMHTLEVAKPKGQDSNPECVHCHVVGLHEKSGFASMKQTPHLAGVQCESCHGPGGQHAEAELAYRESKSKDLASLMPLRERVRRSRFTIKEQCIYCHNSENSVHFNFETYWPKVAHPR